MLGGDSDSRDAESKLRARFVKSKLSKTTHSRNKLDLYCMRSHVCTTLHCHACNIYATTAFNTHTVRWQNRLALANEKTKSSTTGICFSYQAHLRKVMSDVKMEGGGFYSH